MNQQCETCSVWHMARAYIIFYQSIYNVSSSEIILVVPVYYYFLDSCPYRSYWCINLIPIHSLKILWIKILIKIDMGRTYLYGCYRIGIKINRTVMRAIVELSVKAFKHFLSNFWEASFLDALQVNVNFVFKISVASR